MSSEPESPHPGAHEGHDHQDHAHPQDQSDHDDAGHGHDHSQGVARWQVMLIALSGGSFALGWLIHLLQPAWGFPATSLFMMATLTGGALILPHALESMRRLRLDMNVLMTVAVAGAWIIGEGAEGAAVVFLFAVAEMLESWSVGRARRAVKALLQLTPDTATRIDADGRMEQAAATSIRPGDHVQIRSGERIPLDGTVLTGHSSVNQAPITGESVPVEKNQSDTVYAGTINGEGALTITVTKAAGDTTLARIIHLVGEAEEQKAPTQRWVDRFAQVYTPAVFILAVLVALLPPLLTGGEWALWAYRAMVLLVIACPCALVISTPVSVVSGLTALARRGVLVKGGAHLEVLGKLRALAVDKTGTITAGKPRVTEIIPLHSDLGESDILQRAAAIDTHSTHPLAEAVVKAAKERHVSFTAADAYQARTGRGAEAQIDGHPHFIGNHRMAHDLGVCTPDIEARLAVIEGRGESLAVLGHTPHHGCEGRALGILAIGDSIRPEAAEALKRLRHAGIEKIVMLSGDNQRTASAIAVQAGIDEARGDLMPEQKVTQVKELLHQYHWVGMVGDGVNDAPALATASVGIAMGAIGSDTAIETADVALMNDDLRHLADAIHTGRRAMHIIQFNIAFAIGIKALFLLLALLGMSSLWLAILADTGATLLVILNALRLLSVKAFSSNPEP